MNYPDDIRLADCDPRSPFYKGKDQWCDGCHKKADNLTEYGQDMLCDDCLDIQRNQDSE